MAAARTTFIQKLLRSAAQFSAGQMAAMLAAILRIGVSARVLTHDVVGLWIGMQLVMSYGANLHLGALFGAYRSIPMLQARGEPAAAYEEKRTSFTFVLVVSFVAAIPLYVVTKVVCRSASTKDAVAVVALVGLTLFRGYFNTIFKAQSRFKELAAAMAWGGAASIVLLPTIAKVGLDGLILCTAAQIIVEVGYLVFREAPPKLAIRLSVLWAQMRVGLMTLLTSVGFVLITTVDRTVMLDRFGTTETGYYYIGANIMALMPIIAAMPAAVLTPQFFERVGRGEDVGPLVEKPVTLGALGFASLVAIG
jgi:O-antigen/teichoic acid export membrane protein